MEDLQGLYPIGIQTLLTSTLHSYFSGWKELFQGLAMEKLEKEWMEYPVLHFDSFCVNKDENSAKRFDKALQVVLPFINFSAEIRYIE